MPSNGIKPVLEKLEAACKSRSDSMSNKGPFKPWLELFDVKSVKDALDMFSSTGLNLEWYVKHAGDSPYSVSDLADMRKRVNFMSGAMRDYKGWYASGDDSHAITDIDPFRDGIGYIDEYAARIKDDIRPELEDSNG